MVQSLESTAEEIKAFMKLITTSEDHLEYMRNENNFEAHALLFSKKFTLNKHFKFDKITTKKLLALNTYLKERQQSIYKTVLIIESDLKKQSRQNSNWFKNYSIIVDCSVFNSKLFKDNNELYTKPLFRSKNLFFFTGTDIGNDPKVFRFFHTDIESSLFKSELFKHKHSSFFWLMYASTWLAWQEILDIDSVTFDVTIEYKH